VTFPKDPLKPLHSRLFCIISRHQFPFDSLSPPCLCFYSGLWRQIIKFDGHRQVVNPRHLCALPYTHICMGTQSALPLRKPRGGRFKSEKDFKKNKEIAAFLTSARDRCSEALERLQESTRWSSFLHLLSREETDSSLCGRHTNRRGQPGQSTTPYQTVDQATKGRLGQTRLEASTRRLKVPPCSSHLPSRAPLNLHAHNVSARSSAADPCRRSDRLLRLGSCYGQCSCVRNAPRRLC
jgi:hypothetical protein